MTDHTRSLLLQDSELQQEIHFDSLLARAQMALDRHAPQWSDRDDHDPGITLLQALAYSASDLAYRHTLPLPDLLTAAPSADGQAPAAPLFPAGFGPAEMLSCAPVTEEDYRRFILDLRHVGTVSNAFFCFRNVRWLPDANAAYFVDNWGDYHWGNRSGVVGKNLLGHSILYVEMAPGLSNEGGIKSAVEVFEREYMLHRGLCERLPKMSVIRPHEIHPKIEFNLTMGGVENLAHVLAKVYLEVHNTLRPEAQRKSVAAAVADGVSQEILYQGPALKNGWIHQLPPMRNYHEQEELHISPLFPVLAAIPGIEKVRALGFGEERALTCIIPAMHHIQPWGDSVETMLQHVQLYWNQTLIRLPDVNDVKAALASLSVIPASLFNLPKVPSGRYRKPGRMMEVAKRLPSCYQNFNNPEDTQRWMDFVGIFEKKLNDSASRLANLPQDLSFQRADTSKDDQRDAKLVEYLLSYFGIPAINADIRSLPARRKQLSCAGQLGFGRGTGGAESSWSGRRALSPMQLSIAGRLGMVEAFDKNEKGSTPLPFYLIEHDALLPHAPDMSIVDNEYIVDSGAIDSSYSVNLVFSSEIEAFSLGDEVDVIFKDVEDFNIYGAIVRGHNLSEGGSVVFFTVTVNEFYNHHLLETSLWDGVVDILKKPAGRVIVKEKHKFLHKNPWIVTADKWNSADKGFVIQKSDYPFVIFEEGQKVFLTNQPYGRPGNSSIPLGWTYKEVEVSIEGNTVKLPYPNDPKDKPCYWRMASSMYDGVPLVFAQSLVFKASDLDRADEIRQVVAEVTPVHIKSYVHFFEGDSFDKVARAFAKWESAQPSYELLELLRLGTRPV